MASDESFYLQNLFYTRNGEPMEFSLRLCRGWETLYEEIARCGGNLTTGKGPHTIRLLPSDDCITSSHGDNFKVQYIHDCIKEGRLLPIGDYRVEKNSCYDDKIDPMDILLGTHSWSDCQRVKLGEKTQVEDDAFFDEMEPSSSSSSTWTSSTPRSRLNFRRKIYTHTERKAIVDFIIKNKRFSDVKGNNLWKLMEDKQVCPGYSWQSMKNHYKHKIIPNLEPFKLRGHVVKRMLRPFAVVPGQMSDSVSESQEDVGEEKGEEQQEVEVKVPTTPPKKSPLEKSPTVMKKDRKLSPRKMEEVQAKNREHVAREEEIGSGETRDQEEQVRNVVIRDQEEQAKSIELKNLEVAQGKNRESDVPERQLENISNEKNGQKVAENRQISKREEQPKNIQSNRYPEEDVMKMKNTELGKQMKDNSMSKNEEVMKETEERCATTRKNTSSKAQELEKESVIEKPRLEGVCCAETSADSQRQEGVCCAETSADSRRQEGVCCADSPRLHPPVQCSRVVSSQSVIQQGIQECNNNENRAVGVSKQKKPEETSEISDKQSKQNNGTGASAICHEEPIRTSEDTRQISEEDATLAERTVGVASGQATLLNHPCLPIDFEGELISTHNVHKCDKDLREQEDDTTAVRTVSDNPLSSPSVPTSFSADDIHSSVRSVKRVVSSPADACNTVFPQSPCNTGNNNGEKCEDMNSNPSLLLPEEFFADSEENLCVKNPENECSNEVQIGKKSILISQPCHTQPVEEKNKKDKSSKNLKDSACGVEASKPCNEDSPAGQLSSATDLFTSAVSEDDAFAELYESAQDTVQAGRRMSPVKNHECAIKLPSTDFLKAYLTDSDSTDSLTGVLFDVDEELNLNLRVTSSDNNSNTVLASSYNIKDRSNVASSSKVEATGDACHLPNETKKSPKHRILKEHQDETQSSLLGHALEREFSGTDNLSSSGDEELAPSERGLPSTSEKRTRGKGRPGGKKRHRRIHRSASTSSNSSTDNNHGHSGSLHNNAKGSTSLQAGRVRHANRKKIAPKKKRKVVEQRKRGPSAKSGNSSTLESDNPVQRWVPQGNLKQKKIQLQFSSSLTPTFPSNHRSKVVPARKKETGVHSRSSSTKKLRQQHPSADEEMIEDPESLVMSEKEDDRESCYLSETDSDPASNIDCYTGRFDRTFYPRLGCTTGLRRKDSENMVHRVKDAYTMQEDLDILEYIEQHRAFHRVGGRELWQEMEGTPTFSHRTWHSLKERFKKRIMPRLHTYIQVGLSEASLNKFVHRINIKQEEPQQRAAGNYTYRQPYSYADDCAVVKFISRTQRYSEVGGKSMWELMAVSEPALKGRTWLSLKERYRKSILPRIDTFMLTKEEIDHFRNKTVVKQNKKKAPPAKRKVSDQNVAKSPYDYNERTTGMSKREKFTQSMIDLKLKKHSKAKAKLKLRELDKFDEEEGHDQPSTSGYVPAREYSSSELESEATVTTVQPVRPKCRRISNRDSSNNIPQRKKLFTSNNSPTSDDLSPHTPFSRDTSSSSMRSNLMKKRHQKLHQKLTTPKMTKDIKDVRIVLDSSWLDMRGNQTGRTNSSQKELAYNPPQQSTHTQKDEENSEAVITSRPEKAESRVGKVAHVSGDDNCSSNTDTRRVEEEPPRGKKATTESDERSVVLEKKSCTDMPSEGAKLGGKAVKGESNANDDGGGGSGRDCRVSRSGTSRIKSTENSQLPSSVSSPTRKKCNNTSGGRIPGEGNLETQQNIDHPQENVKKGSENEIVRDKSQELSEQEINRKREAMQSKVKKQRTQQDSALAKPFSTSNSALDAQSRVRDDQNTADSPTSSKDVIKRSGTSKKSSGMNTRDTSSSSDSKTSCSIKSKEGAGTFRDNSDMRTTTKSCKLKKTSKGSTSNSALIDVGNFSGSEDSDKVQTDVDVKGRRDGSHSKRKIDSKSSVVKRQNTRPLPEMMTLPMGKLRKKKVKKKK